jgi:hypothetical protein
MSGTNDSGPYLVVTCVVDAGARPAAVTRAHGEALDRAIRASTGKPLSGLDIVELPIENASHLALRKHLGLGEESVGVYDVFPLSPKLDPRVRKAAAQFLAAEQLWTLDAQGVFGTDALSIKLDLPGGWDKDPQAVHQKLVEAGALELSEADVATFRAVKDAWTSA